MLVKDLESCEVLCKWLIEWMNEDFLYLCSCISCLENGLLVGYLV